MSTTVELPTNGLCRLQHLAVLSAQGADAAAFLHGQLTQDFSLLGTDQARLAALCSPQGRMLASFIGLKHAADRVLLICSQDLASAALKRLSMFVLRAKVKLSDVSDEFELLGCMGDLPTDWFTGPPRPWRRCAVGGATAIELYPAAGHRRALWIAAKDLVQPNAPALDASVWAWLEVMSGIATVTAAMADSLVPQMLNYESVDGVSFKKGCYPGQEVVARSQFRGAVKRRTYLLQSRSPLHIGQEVYAANLGDQPCGVIVQAAAQPHTTPLAYNGLACLQVAAVVNAQPLGLALANGQALQLLPLPYRLRDDL